MASPSEKLAASLEELRILQERGHIAIQSSELTRTHRERLLKHGFIKEVMKGWYIPIRPDETAGESTAWYASFWQFCSAYMQERRGDNWSLSPEQSISLHAENWTVPAQLLVRATAGQNNIIALPFETSLLEVRATLPNKNEFSTKNELKLFSLPSALLACSPTYFSNNPIDMRTALSMIQDSSEVLEKLLNGGHSIIAGRLAGAFRNIGREQIADDIIHTMKSAGYDVRENNPFETPSPIIFSQREQSPYVNRLRLMWQQMREPIIEHFPPSELVKDIAGYMQQVEDIYGSDAYHSLSIEGYRVSPELVEQVRSGDWHPKTDKGDKEHRDALAARGYWQAFQEIKESIKKILDGNNAGDIVSKNHRDWYREMFSPSITAGLLKPSDLAGYRNAPVYIRRSMHVPPSCEAVRDAMPAFFELLKAEPEPSVRIVLGHFIFVYIHPYIDGNGRIGRFLMNTMMASGGYPWLVIPVEEREKYMASLEEASVNHNIVPFAQFLAGLIRKVR